MDRWVSLWAPVTLLAVVFLVYLCVVESSVCTYLWLQPVMQGIGLFCFAWWASLVGARVFLRRWNEDRVARYHADGVLAETERSSTKNRAALKDSEWNELIAGSAALLKAYPEHAANVLEAKAKLLKLSDTILSRFRAGAALGLTSGFVRALLIALLFRAVLIEPYKIPSGSMIPTLEIGDQIFVNKFLYGVRIPFTNYVPFVLVRPPRRGDVIVFNNPIHTEVDYIKRIIGVPGDRLEFTDTELLLNGVPLARSLENADYSYADQPRPLMGLSGAAIARWFEDDWAFSKETLYRETVDGQQYYVLENPEVRELRLSSMFEKTIVVPENSVFVMGDNRNHSEDSRFGLGSGSNRPEFVPYGHIKGKATVIWLSLSKGGFLSSIFGGTGIRYDRFFRSVSLCGSEAPRT
jgi:signal peptidase I